MSDLRHQAKKVQEELLSVILEIFRKEPTRIFSPSDISHEAGLFKRLNDNVAITLGFSGTHNDWLAQSLINELLNRDKIKRITLKGRRKTRNNYQLK